MNYIDISGALDHFTTFFKNSIWRSIGVFACVLNAAIQTAKFLFLL